MTVLALYGSPRKNGNSDLLLDEAVRGAVDGGATVHRFYARDLAVEGCRECGGCDKTGICVIRDAMDEVYPLLVESSIIITATPVFFYGVPSQLKAIIDRCQALWSKRMLSKTKEQRRRHDAGVGYLIAVGATGGERLFDPIELTIKYFYDALDKSYGGGIFFRNIDRKGDIALRPEQLQKAYRYAHDLVAGTPG